MTTKTPKDRTFPLLMSINSPADLRLLEVAQLPLLAEEVRQYLYQTLNTCGGHFGASLGVTELSIALHYIYNTPNDKLVWDVGHQAYVHKILTGRRDQLHTIRQDNGLTPFPTRSESPYDAFGGGHSGNSISGALGMAIAAKLNHSEDKAVAIIGDGGMTAGMAFEALNHAGAVHCDMLVILNDNDMSISYNVGALSNYFARILSGQVYGNLREGSKKVLKVMPQPLWDLAKRTETQMKDMISPGITPGTFFEELGFNYIGPVDGHDLATLVGTLRNLRKRKGPQLLHVITKKGKGYLPAEVDPIAYHAVKPGFYEPLANNSPSSSSKKLSYSNIFGEWLCDMAALDERLVGITPAMREGSDLIAFSERYPDRYFDVGIAEQHSITLAAGLACAGKKPVVAIYSSFLQRAYDQLIHDVALQNLPVVLAIDRAGVVGGDGATHHGNFDLSFLRCIPNMIIMAPSNENETRQMLYTAFLQEGPTAVRYPRGSGNNTPIEKDMQALPIGKAELLRKGKQIAILAFGSMVNPCLAAGNKLDASVINMRFVKPLDSQMIKQIADSHELIVTVEENALAGGAGSAVNEVILSLNKTVMTHNLGIPDQFIEHGNPDHLLELLGLTEQGIVNTIKQLIKKVNCLTR